MMSMDDL